MKYGIELINSLEAEIEMYHKNMTERMSRIDDGMTDMDDCFMSQRVDERGISTAKSKIHLLKNGGCAWFTEYATLDGQIINARWCDTRYGLKLRAEMPDGSVVWTTADTAKGLAKKGIKKVECLRPAWFAFHSSSRGLAGVYGGDYVLFPSDYNYATGEPASAEPIEMKDAD